jgi:hypothetical protein
MPGVTVILKISETFVIYKYKYKYKYKSLFHAEHTTILVDLAIYYYQVTRLIRSFCQMRGHSAVFGYESNKILGE